MKYFCCSDIHGDYEALMRAIIKYDYNPNDKNHQLIICGDCFGRAQTDYDGSLNTYSYLTSTIHANKPIILYGNHEDILLNIIRRKQLSYTDIINGENKTLVSLSGVRDFTTTEYNDEMLVDEIEKRLNISKWINKLSFYYETKTHIFVHGWFPKGYLTHLIEKNDWEFPRENWIEASWSQTPVEVDNYIYRCKCGQKLNKTIVFGHWHAADFHELYNGEEDKDDIWVDTEHGLVALDCCAARSHNIEMYVFEEEEE